MSKFQKTMVLALLIATGWAAVVARADLDSSQDPEPNRLRGLLTAVVPGAAKPMAISEACRLDASHCDQELRAIRKQAREIWADRLADKRHLELINFRFCQDFKSCFERDCERTRKQSYSYAHFKSASRPFIMLSRSGARARGTVVFVHGLSDSPYSGGALAEVLSQKGYNVVAILLSGHGGDHREGAVPSPNDWRSDVDHGVKLAKQIFGDKGLIVSGFSTGGALVVDFLERHQRVQKQIVANVLFDPALALPWVAEKALQEEGVVGQALINVGRLQEWWGEDKSDTSPARFRMKDTRDAVPLMQLISEIRKREESISTPTLALLSNGSRYGGQTIDPIRVRAELESPGDGRPGLLAGEKAILDFGQVSPEVPVTVGHTQLVTRENLALCKPNFPTDPNPYFDRMMKKVVAFLNQKTSVQPQEGAPETP